MAHLPPTNEDAPTLPHQAPSPLVAKRRALPQAPGVYRFLDDDGTVIYVGKAINLHRRVNQYFTGQRKHDFKTRVLVDQVADLAYTVVRDEREALLLENNLIKQLQPKYNILLKDGKSYPYIVVRNEPFPRVYQTRQRYADGSAYYGPYTSVPAVRAILKFLRETYKLRTCTLKLSEANIRAGKFRPCLEYHINKCEAPCVAKQTEAEYMAQIKEVRQVLSGRFRPLLESLKDDLTKATAELRFEDAHRLQTRIDQIQKLRRRSTVVSEQVGDVEVLALQQAQRLAVVNHFRVADGTVVGAHAFTIKLKGEEAEEELLRASFRRIVAETGAPFPTILSNISWVPRLGPDEDAPTLHLDAGEADPNAADAWPPPEPPMALASGLAEAQGLTVKVPTRGDELKLVQLAVQNCAVMLEEKLNASHVTKREARRVAILQQLQQDLRLTRLPRHIECFDNSHIQGFAPVSACVVFREGLPSKRDYRTYKNTSFEGVDDYAAMREAVHRRYRRLMEEEKPLPDLIVIDGGKGQLSAALEALTGLGIATQVAVVAIAKRLEEIYFKDDPVPLYIDKKSPSLHLLQRIRNEAHNTVITFHRKQRSKRTIKTGLVDLPGVGPATAKKLLGAFGSVAKVKEAPISDLQRALGPAKGKALWHQLHTTPPEAPDTPDAPSATPNS